MAMAAVAGRGIMKLIGATTGKTIGFLTSGKARRAAKGVAKVAKKVAPAAKVAGDVYGAYKNNKANKAGPPAAEPDRYAGTAEEGSHGPSSGRTRPRPKPAGPPADRFAGSGEEGHRGPSGKKVRLDKYVEQRKRMGSKVDYTKPQPPPKGFLKL